ncbi:hypothetical protein ACI3PL_29785, partial [Lacticaseibacillus paracasei]
ENEEWFGKLIEVIGVSSLKSIVVGPLDDADLMVEAVEKTKVFLRKKDEEKLQKTKKKKPTVSKDAAEQEEEGKVANAGAR